MRLSLDARHWAVARLDETKRTETSDQPAGTYKKTHAYKGPVSTDAKHPRSRGHTSPESIQRRAVPDGFLLADTRRWAACPRARQVGELTHASTGRTCHAHPWYMLMFMYSYMPCSHGRSLAGAVGSNWKSTPALRERAGQPSSARARECRFAPGALRAPQVQSRREPSSRRRSRCSAVWRLVGAIRRARRVLAARRSDAVRLGHARRCSPAHPAMIQRCLAGGRAAGWARPTMAPRTSTRVRIIAPARR